MEMKHSGFGISSFISSIIIGSGMFLLIIFATIMESSSQEEMSDDSPIAIILGLMLIGSLMLNFVSLGLAIAGLCQKNRKKVFSILGLVFSLLIFLGVTGLMIIGMLVS